MIRRLALALVLTACGSKHTEPAAAPKPAEVQMSPEMTKLHGLLAPQWQEAPGPQRMKDTCASLPDYHADADAIAKATPPTTANADTWTTATRQLVDAVAGLDTACQTVDPAQFDPAFAKVHDAYDALSAAAGTPKM